MYCSKMMLFRTRITANIPQIKENINFTKIHGQFSAIHVDSLLERESPQIIRKLKLMLFHKNSRSIYDNLRSQKKTSCSALSMLPSISQRPHVIRWLFPFDIAKVQHFRGALSVSVRFSPQRASFGWICPLESIKCYKSMPNCSATYFTATGGSSLSHGLTPSMASVQN